MERSHSIQLNPEIQIVTTKGRQSTAFIAEGFAMLFCVLGCIYTVYKNLDIPKTASSFFATLIFPILLTWLFNLKSHKIISISGSLVAVLIGIYLFYKQIVQALFILNAKYLGAVNAYYHKNYRYYHPNFTEDEYNLYVTVFLICAIFLLSLLFGFFIVQLKSAILTAVLILPFAFFAVKFAEFPNVTALALLLLGFIITYTMNSISYTKKGKKENQLFILRKWHSTNTYHYFNISLKNKTVLSSSLIMVSIALAVVTVINFAVPRNSFNPSIDSKFTLDKIIDKFDGVSIKEFLPSKVSGGISGGNIGNVDEIRYTNELHLKVKTDIKTPMYLKAYVGSEYRDNGWHDLDANYTGSIFARFEKLKVFPNLMGVDFNEFLISKGKKIQKEMSLSDVPVIETNVYVQNVAAENKYIYYPYHLKTSPVKLSLQTDTLIRNSDYTRKPYKLTSYLHIENDGSKGQYTPFSSPVDYMAYQYINDYNDTLKNNERSNLDMNYWEFIYQAYTVPQELSNLLPKLQTYDTQNNIGNMDEIINEVREITSSRADYTLKPGKTPKDKDLVEYFLFENRKGYCVHFATAATMILRANGIPARYVEGYTVTQNDYDEAVKNKSDTLQIRDTNAHAWIEVYQPLIGWVPYEVTPGYSEQSVPQQNYKNAGKASPPQEMDKLESTSSETTSSEETSSTVVSKPSEIQTSSPSDNNLATLNYKMLVLKGIIYLAVIFVIIVLTLLIRRYIILRKRKKAFGQNNINKSTISMYQYICELLNYLGYDKSKYSNLQAFAITVENKCNLIEDNTLLEVTNIAHKARFSQHIITVEEQTKALSFASKLNKEIYSSLNFFKKLWYKYVEALK